MQLAFAQTRIRAVLGLYAFDDRLDTVELSLLEKLVPEIKAALDGAIVRSVHSLGMYELAIAFDAEEFRILYVNVEPRHQSIYLIKRRLRDLKKQSIHPTQFTIAAEKFLAGRTVTSIDQLPGDRILELVFSKDEKASEAGAHALMIQLTGRSSNLFLLDGERRILIAGRKPGDESQAIGSTYLPPQRKRESESALESSFLGELDPSSGQSISEGLDALYQDRNRNSEFEAVAASARNANEKEIAKRRKLIANLEADLADHGDAERWKRYGDLLLANTNSTIHRGSVIRVADLFDEATPMIEIEAGENESVADAAQSYFRKYAKSRNAQSAIAARLAKTKEEIKEFEQRRIEIENAVTVRNLELLKGWGGSEQSLRPKKRAGKVDDAYSGIRIFRSSDGFEILVGKKAKDNDHLTFKIANSRDMWMHAADYPGSHVVIRNPDRKELPQKTLVEAAQLAAFYSQGNKQPKAAVHYTLKKFVNKPKRAAAGLVSLASFKTLLVEPGINVEPQKAIR